MIGIAAGVARSALVAAISLAAIAPALAQLSPGAPNCADPQAPTLSQAQMSMCEQAAQAKADADMNEAYARVIDHYRKQDADFAREGPRYVGAEKLLRESQEAWMKSRADFCSARTLPSFGGSMVPAVRASCLAMLARSRTVELRWVID